MDQAVSHRLDRLERENRFFKALGLVAIAVIVAVVLMGQATGAKVAKVIEAEKFVLRDADGKVRAIVEVDMGRSASLRLKDESGTDRVLLMVLGGGEFGSSLSLADKDGKSRAWMEVSPDAKSKLIFADKNGTQRVWLQTLDDGSPILALKDKGGATRTQLFVGPDSAPSVALYDRNGLTLRTGLGVDPEGGVGITHFDKEGKYRANFGVTKDGSPQLVFYDKATNAIWSAPGQQVAGSSRLWILWARAFAGQYTETMALTTWPTKNQCEQDRTARLSKITREPGSGINFVCLPEGIDPRGTDRILLLDLFRFHP